ncbi:MAG: enoyl-CoA hydratase/isomerase family protein [Brevundimonas sp.]|uniref:enoyl-CoA hydratase-related protein n=1 Tax=Brevundimonas sp. TaxID=1871086 RepID=UPI002588D3B4|nr:enoyl-CoA hydratase-related protein [Brevundimonas sp.]MCV0413846.1 enoyl-CoA hydratase/isomerase family protein [Brevundimonas sp.]
MTDNIKVSKANGVLTLTFDRPDKKNAITDNMYEVLANELESAETDSAVRAIVIRSEGDLFTAGNDVSEFARAAMSGMGLVNVGRFIVALARATKPLVGAVQGKAVGVGTTLLLHCDHVILADDAQLTTPFVNLALVPEAASTMLLSDRIGHARAYTMFALGQPVGATEALAWGLANQVVSRADLDATAATVAAKLAAQPLGALMATKKLMRDAAVIQRHIEVEGEIFAAAIKTPEAQEAFMAFAQRRAPDFSQFC